MLSEEILKIKGKTITITRNKDYESNEQILEKEDEAAKILESVLFLALLVTSMSCVFFKALSPFWFALSSYTIFAYPKQIKYILISILIAPLALGLPYMFRAIFFVGLIFAYSNLYKRSKDNKLLFSLVSFLACLVTGLIINLIYKGNMLQSIYVIIEALLTLVMFHLYQIGIPSILNYRQKTSFSNEEIISLNIVFSVFIAGFSFFTFANFSFAHVLASFAVLFCAYYFDLGCAMVQAITSGFFISLASNGNYQLIALLAVCALFVSLLNRYSAIGATFIFCGVGSVMSFYINRSIIFIITPSELIIASILHLLILYFLGDSISEQRKNLGEKQVLFNEAVKKVIKDEGDTQKNMLLELSKNITTYEYPNKENLEDEIIKTITSDVCSSCNMFSHCWQKEAQKTYDAFYKVLNIYNENPSVAFENLPNQFASKCNKSNLMFKTISYLSDFNKLKNSYNLKINKFKEVLNLQLKHVSTVLDKLSDQLAKGVTLYIKEGKTACAALERNGIKIEKLTIMEDFNNKTKVFLKPSTRLNSEVLRKNIPNILEEVLEKDLCFDYTLSNPNAMDKLEYAYSEEYPYSVALGNCRCAKSGSNASRDNYSDLTLNNGKHLIALSDGMGSGLKACNQSSRVLNMLEDLLNGSYDEIDSIKTINSILVLEEDEEVFSTLDMMLFDLDSAKARFIKACAVPTFIKRGLRVVKIEKSSLPLGIIEQVNVKDQVVDLSPGDFVFFMSDGFYNVVANNEEAFMNKLSDLDFRNPQKIAEELFNDVINKSEGIPKDDISILVAKIRSRY